MAVCVRWSSCAHFYYLSSFLRCFSMHIEREQEDVVLNGFFFTTKDAAVFLFISFSFVCFCWFLFRFYVFIRYWMKASESRTMARAEWRLWWLRWMNGKNAENINFLAFFVQNFAWNHTISRIVQTNENRCDIIVCELCVILDISIAKRQNLWQSKRNREQKIAEIPLDGVCQSRRYRASIVCFAWAAICFAEKMPDAGNENDEPINVHKNGYLSENLFICIYGRRRQNTDRLYSLHAFHAIFIFFLSSLSLLVWEWCWSAWGHGIVCTSHNHKMTIKKIYWRKKRGR